MLRNKRLTNLFLAVFLVLFCVLIAFEFTYKKGFTREYHGVLCGSDGKQLAQTEPESISLSGTVSYNLRTGVRLEAELTGSGLDCRFITLANDSLEDSGWYRALLSGGPPEPGPVSMYGSTCNEVFFSKKLDAFMFPMEQGDERSFLVLTEQEGAVEGPGAIIAEFFDTDSR